MSMIPTITAALIVLPFSLAVLVGCDNQALPVVEKSPEILPWTASARVEGYRQEFQTRTNSAVASIPALGDQIQGKVFHSDFSAADAVWSIVTHGGAEWHSDQRLYLYFAALNRTIQINAFAGEALNEAYTLQTTRLEKPLVVVGVVDKGFSPYRGTICLLDGATVQRVSSGSRLIASPDHTKCIFLRMTSQGFHSLYLWERREIKPECILSLWEEDPGSGTSWKCSWAADSGAIRIKGACGGFQKRAQKYQDIDLVYVLGERKMYSLK